MRSKLADLIGKLWLFLTDVEDKEYTERWERIQHPGNNIRETGHLYRGDND